MPKAPKYVGFKKGINLGSLLYANEERLFWVRFSETALITASGLPFYISLLAYFPFFLSLLSSELNSSWILQWTNWPVLWKFHGKLEQVHVRISDQLPWIPTSIILWCGNFQIWTQFLFQALAGFMRQTMHGSVSFDPSQMVITCGATPAMEILSFCIADPGNAFLVPSPYYPG